MGKRIRWLCAALLVLAGVPAQAQRLNLILVTIDTLRPDRLGCYGNSNIRTPNLDRLAKSGVLFENAVTPTPLTAPSHATLFTGLYPTVHKVRDTGGFILDPAHKTLASRLREQGWDTAAFVGSSVLARSFGFDQGFALYDDQMPRKDPAKAASEYAERSAAQVVDRATAWLASRTNRPFFLWAHLFDPHSPYDPPPPFRDTYRGRLYDGEAAYVDRELGRLFAVASKFHNTVIAVLSDHGESLSEHGEYNHGVFLYDSTVRVAFLLAGPGVPAGVRVKQQARTVDVLPTLLQLIGAGAAPEAQGTSLVPAFRGKTVASTWCYLETLYPKINMGWAELRGIRTAEWKYIRAPRPELYDLVHDPGEKHNVIASHPVETRQLEARLRAMAGTGVEKVATRMAGAKTLAQLKSLGYLGGSSAAEYTLTGTGVDPKQRVDVLRLLYRAVSPDSGSALAQRIPLLREALNDDPGDPAIYFHLGDEYRRTGQISEEKKLYQTALDRGLRNAWLYSRMAFLDLQQGQREQAIASYEKAAQLNPSDVESLGDLAAAYLESGKPADAERVFRWSLTVDDRFASAYNGLGLIAVRRQDYPAARDHFAKAVEFDPDLLEARLNLGRVYKILGQYAEARQCFEQFLKQAPPEAYAPIIARLKEELKSMP